MSSEAHQPEMSYNTTIASQRAFTLALSINKTEETCFCSAALGIWRNALTMTAKLLLAKRENHKAHDQSNRKQS